MHENILITGGAGFAGSALALSIKRRFPESRVYAFDNLKRRGSEMNLPRLRAAGVEFVHGDVRDLSDLLALPKMPDLIIEASAEPSAQAGYGGSPQYLIDTNLMGCYNCLELARRSECDFFFLSTSRVYPYRMLNSLEFVETEKRFQLTSAQSVRGAYGFRYFIERFGVLTGPWQMAKSDQGVVALWVAAHVLKKNLAYIGFGGQGKQVRDFLHVDDFCDLVIAQIEDFGAFHGKRLNAGGGNAVSTSLCELTQLCEEVTGNRLDFRSEPENRPADVRVFITDHRQLSAIHGWKPLRSAQSTVQDIFEWVRANETLVRTLITN